VHIGDFDVSELSLSSLSMVTASGNRDWVGIPVFTVHRFFHTWSWIGFDRGIDKPEDLRHEAMALKEVVIDM
jgi:4,5-dihydroxyphthalate decarboxylase